MGCKYCDGDEAGYFKLLPKCNITNYCATIDKQGTALRKPVIKFVSKHEESCFEILYCPMCGKKLSEGGNFEMKKYKFLVDGWSDEEAYYCNAFTLSEALFLFEHFMCYEHMNYSKFICELVSE